MTSLPYLYGILMELIGRDIMKTFKLYLVRHGITQANLEGVYVGGGSDVPLCEAGIEELQLLKKKYEYPSVAVVFSSPMQRALQTAEILFPAATNKIVVEDLRENLFGEFENRKIDDLMTNERFALWLNPENKFIPEGGESVERFSQRTAEGLQSIFQYMIKNEIVNAACVTHGGVIMSMLSQLGIPRLPAQQWMVQSGCGFVLQSTASMVMRDGHVEVVNTLPFGLEAQTIKE